MADKPVTTDVGANAQYLASTLNANFAIVESAIEGCLGRGGTSESPNSMEGNLDMDLYKIQNLGAPTADHDALRLIDLSDSDATGAASATLRSELGSTADGYGSELIGNNLVLRDTVSDLTSSTIEIGTLVRTLGYYTAGDGGGALYLIESGNSGDGYVDHDVDTNTAILQTSGETNIKQCGAKVDGVTDDSDAILAAVAHSSTYVIVVPEGTTLTSQSINIGSKILKGIGSRKSIIKWYSSDLTDYEKGVVHSTSGTDVSPSIIFSSGIYGITINGSGYTDTSIAIRGWQENCVCADVVASGSIDTVFEFLTIGQTTHGATFRDMHIIPDTDNSTTSTIGMVIKDTQKCLFQNITIDIANDAADNYGWGIKFTGNSSHNIFMDIHTEDADIGIECTSSLNTFINLEAIADTFGGATTHFYDTSGKVVIQNIITRGSGYTNHIVTPYDTILATTNTQTAFFSQSASGGIPVTISDQLPIETNKGALLKSSTFTERNSTGFGISSSVSRGNIATSTTEYVTIKFTTTSAENFALNVEVFGLGDQRYYTERKLSGNVNTSGTVAGTTGSTQGGTDATITTIGLPIAIATPAAGYIRIPLTNNSGTYTQVLEVKITGAGSGGNIESLTFS